MTSPWLSSGLPALEARPYPGQPEQRTRSGRVTSPARPARVELLFAPIGPLVTDSPAVLESAANAIHDAAVWLRGQSTPVPDHPTLFEENP